MICVSQQIGFSPSRSSGLTLKEKATVENHSNLKMSAAIFNT